jgi:peptidoglycan/LPS O-acetylase OafA/YrhL
MPPRRLDKRLGIGMGRHSSSSTAYRRIVGLDTLRFIAALWVALFHGARVPMASIVGKADPVAMVLVGANNEAFNGAAAVMVFFVISGCCIHYPFVANGRLDVLRYLTRRLIRIGVPLAVLLYASATIGGAIEDGANAVLWSVYCEIIYYLVYPLILLAERRVALYWLVGAAWIVSYAVVVTHWSVLYHGFLGVGLSTVVGLPCWLLGCLLAEKIGRREADSTSSIWWWRLAALGLSVILQIPVSHGPVRIGYPASHGLFAIFAYFWIEREISHFATNGCSRMLEWLGRWSYSTYLVHNIVIAAFIELGTSAHPVLLWAPQLAAIGLASYLFYLIVERPSHWLAYRVGDLVTPGLVLRSGIGVVGIVGPQR